MNALETASGGIMCAFAICGVLYCVIAVLLVARFMAAVRPRTSALPSVTIIKPLHGAPPGLLQSLESFCRQDYGGVWQIVFGVQDPGDPAIPVVRELRRRNPTLDIAMVVNARLHGVNRKTSNLINIAARAKHEILILSDADIRVKPDYLHTVVAALSRKDVGVVSCLYVGEAGTSLWSKLSAMAINYQFLPSAVLGKSIGLAQPCFGSTIGIRAQVLREIGGFEALADHLADDYEIGRAVRARGYKIAMPPIVVSHLCTEATARELFDHELRWGFTVRRIDFPGYIGSIVTHPLPLAVIGGALLGFPPPVLWLAAAALLVRIALRLCIDSATGARAGYWWLMPTRDMLSFIVFIASFTVSTVGWHGRRFRVDRDGVLSHT
ncbi:MAG: bacteriohopanetetrol glucosamine biosynthesis glycosyltransferase HpnI [Caulobacteraceae bacterium]